MRRCGAKISAVGTVPALAVGATMDRLRVQVKFESRILV
jgi:hypothetical protein